MDFDLPVGKYVVAVSGGVDSVALLHMLAQRGQRAKGKEQSSTGSTLHPTPYTLIVAHYDHGIRPDSAKDRQLVQRMAKDYGLPFAYEEGKLGAGASEAAAREARYRFLHHVREAGGASAIVTAHHQDDLLETAVLNMLRGTGRKGLSSLKSTDVVKRPLLHVPKTNIRSYAMANDLLWREDSTNQDETYARNYVRKRIVPRLSQPDRERLLGVLERAAGLNQEIDAQLHGMVQSNTTVFDRHQFVMLPHIVAREVMAAWLRHGTSVEVSTKLLERLVQAAKTAKAGTRVDVDAGHWLKIEKTTLALETRER
jgi:tRNA(Ile)-lysidine synthase